jgi:hypothetical protein
LDGNRCRILAYNLLASMPRLCRHIGILRFWELKYNMLCLLSLFLGNTNDILKIFVEIYIGLTIRNFGDLNVLYTVQWVIADVGVVTIAAEEEPSVIILLEIIGVYQNLLRTYHSKTLVFYL